MTGVQATKHPLDTHAVLTSLHLAWEIKIFISHKHNISLLQLSNMTHSRLNIHSVSCAVVLLKLLIFNPVDLKLVALTNFRLFTENGA